MKTIAVFHPSSELYGADRILANALGVLPPATKKVVYLKFEGPLINYLHTHVPNVEVRVVPQLPVIYRAMFTPVGLLRFLWQWMAFGRNLAKANTQDLFNSAYVNTLSCSLILPLLWLLRIKRFVHVHEIIERPLVVGYLTAGLCRLFGQKVVCVSAAVQRQLLRYAPSIKRSTIIIHNGIDAIDAAPAPAQSKLHFYLFGRIMPKKGQWYLLDALRTIPSSELEGARFTLMGGAVPGQEQVKDELLEAIEAAGLTGVVEIKPFAADIRQAMSDADVCLVPSMMKDPFPTTVLEAMSAGRPVIATNHGGAAEALTEGGLLVHPQEPWQLAHGIRHLLANRSLVQRLGTAARNRFQRHFTREKFASNWINMIAQGQYA